MSAGLAIDTAHPTATKLIAFDRDTLIAVMALALLVLVTRGIWFGDPVADFDEQLYSFVGWRLTQGELPFVDWWDRKPFGLFALYALAHTLFGPGALGYQAFAAIFAFVGAILIYALARRMVGPFSATIAASISTTLLAAYGAYSGQSEVFFLPLILGMALLLVDRDHDHVVRRAAFAMLLGGLALQVKYTVLPQCLFFGCYALFILYRRGLPPACLMRLGAIFALIGLLPTLLVAGLYVVIGEFDAFLFANVTSFFLRTVAPQGRDIAQHSLALVPLAFLVGGGVYAAWRMIAPKDHELWLLFTGWTLATLASVLLPGTTYLYYFAAMAAPAVLVALPLLDQSGPSRGLVGVVLLAGCITMLFLPERRAESLAERESARQLSMAIAPYVGASSDCLFVWDGPTALYRMTGSCVPTKYVYPDHLNNALESHALGIDQEAEVARILAEKPGAIITASDPVTLQNHAAEALVMEELSRNYEKRRTVPMHGRKLTAWIRIDRKIQPPGRKVDLSGLEGKLTL